MSDTKRVLKHLDGQGLAELRAMQKPDSEIEDLLAALIIIGQQHSSYIPLPLFCLHVPSDADVYV